MWGVRRVIGRWTRPRGRGGVRGVGWLFGGIFVRIAVVGLDDTTYTLHKSAMILKTAKIFTVEHYAIFDSISERLLPCHKR